MAMDRSGGCHGRADQMGTAARALTTLEVAVAGGCATFAGLQAVGVHRQTHGAARLAPLETGRLENFMQAFTLRLLLDQP